MGRGETVAGPLTRAAHRVPRAARLDMPEPTPEGDSPLDIAALYDAYAPRLHAVALRITGDRTLAADVLEQLLAAVANGTLVFDGAGSFDAWLLRRLRDYALARRQGRTAATGVDVTEASPQSLVEAAYFGGATVAELARATSLPEDEVRRRLHAGMAAIREKFAQTGRR